MGHPYIPEGYVFPEATRRLPYADTESPAVKPVWDKLGFVQDNLFRMLAHAPSTFGPLGSLVHAMLGDLELDIRHRELAIMHVDHVRNAHYGWAWHFTIARDDAAINEQQLAALQKGDIQGELWSEEDRAILRFIDEQIRNGVVGEETFKAAKAYMNDRQLVELLIVIGAYALIGNVMETTELQLEWQPENPLQRKPRA
ncbi:carboxymuconolactone decarboxylase family protein [Pseudomonas sp. NPDC089752]|uniref:carboxymuconolactone decarboxylase family protein n=1 Tax=Pseudomonas sp. NPDC089752 TaxID=3364472 RepID=UPI003821427F